MGWLQDTFPEPEDDSTEVERIRYARAYILQSLRSYLMLDKSRNLIHLRWLANSVRGLPCCRHCIGRCIGRRNQIKSKLEVASHCYNHELSFAFYFYVLE
ncbi:hypothetical protein Gotur_035671 [Gossypium turneri]